MTPLLARVRPLAASSFTPAIPPPPRGDGAAAPLPRGRADLAQVVEAVVVVVALGVVVLAVVAASVVVTETKWNTRSPVIDPDDRTRVAEMNVITR